MRSKRATKLLACVLASSMCTVPVFATSSLPDRTNVTGNSGTIQSQVTLESAVIRATIPTRMNIKINPFYDTASTIPLEKGTLKSEEFIVSNNTSSNGTYVPLLVTVTGGVEKKASDVKLYYKTVSTNDDSTEKKIYMGMASANGTVGISQNSYDMARAVPVVPTVKSQLKVKVPAASGYSVVNAGKGGFAVSGNANVGADWKDDDVTVAFSYTMRPVGASFTVGQQTANISDVTVTSANATSDVTLVPDTVLTKTFLGEANVIGVLLHDPENAFEDMQAPTTDATKIKMTKNATGGCELKLPGNGGALKMLSGYSKKTVNGLVVLSDGRRLPFNIKLNP